MADFSKISVNGNTYNIKDASARNSLNALRESLGSLAYKNEATGTFTPEGSVTAPTITVSPATKSVKVVDSAGTLPAWSATVSEETLSFDFNAGSLPTTTDQTVVTGITDATSSAPVFSGTSGTVNVS